MRNETLSGRPAMGSARRDHIHGKLQPMQKPSLFAKYRAMRIESTRIATELGEPNHSPAPLLAVVFALFAMLVFALTAITPATPQETTEGVRP